LKLEIEEIGCHSRRVNSWASCTRKKSVCCCLLVFFLAASSLEFVVEIFLVTYAIETMLNEWYTRGTRINEGVHSFIWKGQEEERLWKIRIVVGRYQWVLIFMSSEWTMRDHPLLWITRLNSGVTDC
jgi:hypothetical protein